MPPIFSSQILLLRTVKQPFVLLFSTHTYRILTYHSNNIQQQDTFSNFLINVLVKISVEFIYTELTNVPPEEVKPFETLSKDHQFISALNQSHELLFNFLRSLIVQNCGKDFPGKRFGRLTYRIRD